MDGRARIIWIAALAIVALGCAILAAYLCSVLWWGEWAYPELLLPLGGCLLGAVLLLTGIAVLLRRRSGWVAVVRTALLLTVGCCAMTGGLFLRCWQIADFPATAWIVSQRKSPDGLRTAVWSEEACAAVAAYCPPVSHVAVVLDGKEVEAFSVRGADGLQLDWRSSDFLVISYGRGRVLHVRNNVGPVRVHAVPVGFQ